MAKGIGCAECGSEDGVKEFRIYTGHIEVEGRPPYIQRIWLCGDHYPDVKLPTNEKYQPRNCKKVKFHWLHN